MTVTLGFGWWVAPAIVTALAFGWSSVQCAKLEPSRGGYIDLTPLAWLFLHGIAAVVSLVAWLVWAVFT